MRYTFEDLVAAGKTHGVARNQYGHPGTGPAGLKEYDAECDHFRVANGRALPHHARLWDALFLFVYREARIPSGEELAEYASEEFDVATDRSSCREWMDALTGTQSGDEESVWSEGDDA